MFHLLENCPDGYVIVDGLCCEDDTKIQITLTEGALYAQGPVQGIYGMCSTINGKLAWCQYSSPYNVLWWGSNGVWIIGPQTEVGDTSGFLYNPVSGVPYGNGNEFFYHNGTAHW